MMRETGIFSPAQQITNSNTNWIGDDIRNPKWTRVENKLFENALALYDKDTPDRWQRVAAMIPGKTVGDVMKQYKELEDDVSNIEAGLVSVPDYYSSTSSFPFTIDNWVNCSFALDPSQGLHGKRSSSGRPPEHEKKKGVPWTEEEHKQFLRGLKEHGKGDWRSISRNFVKTRTPTQVASHAQKFFIRQLSGGKDKRRASIHDITTVNLTETTNTRTALTTSTISTPSTSQGTTRRSSSPPQNPMSVMLSQSQQQQNSTVPTVQFQWNHQPMAALSDPAHENLFMSDSYGVGGGEYDSSYGFGSALIHHESSYLGPQTQNMIFQMP